MGSCTSRHWVTPGNHQMESGTTVYRLITNEADTISFAGRSVKSIDNNFVTGNEICLFDGNGASYNEGVISGVRFDGSEVVISIFDVSGFEVDKFNTGKTILFSAGVLTASSFLLYTIIKIITEDDDIMPRYNW